MNALLTDIQLSSQERRSVRKASMGQRGRNAALMDVPINQTVYVGVCRKQVARSKYTALKMYKYSSKHWSVYQAWSKGQTMHLLMMTNQMRCVLEALASSRANMQ
eukprot:scaffold41202_cov278-Skeletonema_dohrnii-CCMP3373.AAC.1